MKTILFTFALALNTSAFAADHSGFTHGRAYLSPNFDQSALVIFDQMISKVMYARMSDVKATTVRVGDEQLLIKSGKSGGFVCLKDVAPGKAEYVCFLGFEKISTGDLGGRASEMYRAMKQFR